MRHISRSLNYNITISLELHIHVFCRERDDFEIELTDLKKKFAYLEAAHETTIKERDDLNAQVSTV